MNGELIYLVLDLLVQPLVEVVKLGGLPLAVEVALFQGRDPLLLVLLLGHRLLKGFISF